MGVLPGKPTNDSGQTGNGGIIVGQTPAQEASASAAALGWNPNFVLRQWTLETGGFISNAWKTDNNPAGIKWYPGMTFGTKGSAASDGGYYAHFSDPAQGYVDFVLNNPRYKNVGSSQSVQGEAQLIKQDGWATDPNYVQEIMSVQPSVDSGTGSASSGGSNPLSGMYGPPSGSVVSNFTDYAGAILWVFLGIGVILLGLWIMMNPFSDLTSAIRGTVQQLAKTPLEPVTSAVKSVGDGQKERRKVRESQRDAKREERLARRTGTEDELTRKRSGTGTSTRRKAASIYAKDIDRTPEPGLSF